VLKPVNRNDDLFDEFSSGKEEAFKTLHNAYRHRLQYYALSFSLTREEAEDVVGEAFARCWQSHTTFAGLEHVKNFLYVSTRNAAINFLNAKGRQKVYQAKYNAEQAQQEEPFSHERVESEVLHLIYSGMNTLPTECRRVFELYLKDFDTGEIALQLNISPATVRSQKRRAIQLLRAMLLDKGNTAPVLALALSMLEYFLNAE
jgi:RNA polymerase sigma-70 factor (ECF subfamily)